MQRPKSQESLRSRASKDSLKYGPNVSQPMPQPSRPIIVNDLRHDLGRIKETANVHARQLGPDKQYLIKGGRFDERDLILPRFRRQHRAKAASQDFPFAWSSYARTSYRLEYRGGVHYLVNPHVRPIARDLVSDAYVDTKDLKKAILDDEEAGRHPDVILICLEGFWDMIIRTLGLQKRTSPEWDETSNKGELLQFAETQLSRREKIPGREDRKKKPGREEPQKPEPLSMDVVAMAKWSDARDWERDPDASWPMTILKDEHGLLGTTIRFLSSTGTTDKVVDVLASVQLLTNCLQQQKLATEGVTTIDDFLLLRIDIEHPSLVVRENLVAALSKCRIDQYRFESNQLKERGEELPGYASFDFTDLHRSHEYLETILTHIKLWEDYSHKFVLICRERRTGKETPGCCKYTVLLG
jgi:hypothetical protein